MSLPELIVPQSIVVVIPTYNRSHTLKRAIMSVLEQSDYEVQIIVVDDASTDSTASLVSELSGKYAQIGYIRHKYNMGAQAARNTGARASRAEWICFLDSDDYYLPGSIDIRLSTAKKTGVKVVHSECILCRNDFRQFGIPNMQGNVYADVLCRPGPMFQGMLIHRSAFEKIGYLDETIISYQEWDTSIRLAKWFNFGFVTEPTFVYDCRGLDTISKNMVRDVQGYEQVILKHKKEVVRVSGRRAMAIHCIALADKYRALAMRSKHLEFRLKSFVWWPPLVLGFLKGIASKLLFVMR